ncbi:MAG: RluA family pseudouridine synthase [Patescibacteria group bacterium]|nr:RluA family pseudouridine synthase [Patescibacteria group bacterium]
MKKIIVKESDLGQRIDAWLSTKLKKESRSQIVKLIKAGAVKVGDKEIKQSYVLRAGDIVNISTTLIDVAPKNINRPIVDLSNKVEIIEETKDYIVVVKPAGMIVHYPIERPGALSVRRSPSLVDWLLARHPEAAKIGDDPSRPGIVHRLDKAVSGLIIMALTQASFDDLKRQFKQRLVKKQYQALVYGKIIKNEDVINFPIERSTSGGKMAARPVASEGKKAITEFSVNRRFVNYTLLDVDLKTGRTHQIRCHLAAYGNPIVGDNIYATAATKIKNKKLLFNNIFLASLSLGFYNLAGDYKQYSIDLPTALEKVLARVR